MKRMKHEKHGFTHAENGNHEAYLRGLLWIEENESFDGEDIADQAEESAKEVVAKKRGRPRQS